MLRKTCYRAYHAQTILSNTANHQLIEVTFNVVKVMETVNSEKCLSPLPGQYQIFNVYTRRYSRIENLVNINYEIYYLSFIQSNNKIYCYNK